MNCASENELTVLQCDFSDFIYDNCDNSNDIAVECCEYC